MMPGSWATHNGVTVQVIRMEGGKGRNWGGSLRTPLVVTLKPWPEGDTYTVTDPGGDLRACGAPDGYQPPEPVPVAAEAPFWSSGEPW